MTRGAQYSSIEIRKSIPPFLEIVKQVIERTLQSNLRTLCALHRTEGRRHF